MRIPVANSHGPAGKRRQLYDSPTGLYRKSEGKIKMPFYEWETPQSFFDELNKIFGFTLDVCATPENAKCERYYSSDSLNKLWSGTCWMNPPYDKTISLWIEKAYRTAQSGFTVVCLVQARSSDTAWWHKFVMKSSEIIFIRDRLRFGKNGIFSRANISSVLVVFRPGCQGPPDISKNTYDGRNYVE